MKQICNRYLDKLVRSPFLHGQKMPAYGLFVLSGIAAGFATLFVLAFLFQLALTPLLISAGAGLLAAIVLAYATKFLIGEEIYSFYHYQITVIAASGGALWYLKQPALANLDALILSLGITHAIGRLGCLVAGCCFGRPRSWGVCYSMRHAENGFPISLVDVRLLPIQLIESIWILSCIAACVLMTSRGAQPGSALSWYTVMYGSGRFLFECQRTNAEHWFGRLTEGQATSLCLTAGVAAAELAGLLPRQPVHYAAVLLLLASCLYRNLDRSERVLLSGPHVLELAGAMRAATRIKRIAVRRTSLGLLISAGKLEEAHGDLLHFSISREGAVLTTGMAHKIARLLARLNGSQAVRLVRSSNVFHALIFVRTNTEH
jgi:prolipoprotein diacylglyceryltransferase